VNGCKGKNGLRGCRLINLKRERALVKYMKKGRCEKQEVKSIRGRFPLSEATEGSISRAVQYAQDQREISHE
jgi:hypothetical protein